MKKITVDSERVFALIFELFKVRPWLNQPGAMRSADAPAEAEAVAFLLTAKTASGWAGCSPAAQRVVNSLLLDFMAKLRDPSSSLSRSTWQVDADAPAWSQALEVIAQEIRLSHPPLATTH